MTFIASVIAKKGVALIADSLVTSMEKVIEYKNFLEYLKEKSADTPLDEIKIEPDELTKLFNLKPSHTKDYEEKLFQYDDYIGVLTAGTASINSKRIEYLINEKIVLNKKDPNYHTKSFETKINEFCEYLNIKAIEHLKTFKSISGTTFIFSYFDKHNNKTEIYNVSVTPCSEQDIVDDTFNCIAKRKNHENYRVVCDGQNRISERILFGEIDFFFDITPIIIEKVLKDFNIKKEDIPADYIKNFFDEARTLLPRQFFDDMKNQKLAGLSLQEAVDLASLLMKIEINFQKYTENIPTVGGVIKIAVIDKNGFRFISGNDIIKPENNN